MNEVRVHIMRFILVLLLFQFIAPAFTIVNAQGAVPDRKTCDYHQLHHSIVIPLLLKEKEETESRGDDHIADPVPLIDFTHHSYVLAEFHGLKLTPFIYHYRYDHQPPLFALHSSFLI